MSLPHVAVLGVHGVTVTGPYAEAWEVALEQGRPDAAWTVTEARWPSTGGFKQDVAMLLMSPGFRRDAVEEVAEAVGAFGRSHRDGALVGHSMGQPLLFAALRHLAERGEAPALPIITLGGPVPHRVAGPVLRAAGLGRCPPGGSVAHYWNDEDPICGRYPVHPSWMTAQRVSIPGRARGGDEHPAELYLSHILVASAVLDAGRGRVAA